MSNQQRIYLCIYPDNEFLRKQIKEVGLITLAQQNDYRIPNQEIHLAYARIHEKDNSVLSLCNALNENKLQWS